MPKSPVSPAVLSRRSTVGGLGVAALLVGAAPALAAADAMPWERRVVSYRRPGATAAADDRVEVEVLQRGAGPLVLLLPSLGRGAEDFDDLTRRLARAGFRTAAVNPRGIGRSRGAAAMSPSLADYVEDVAQVIVSLTGPDCGGRGAPVPIIGHAYGNRLARAVASQRPELVSALVLLAAGGQVAMKPEVARALLGVFDPALSPAEHLQAVRTAFFAPGNDPQVWRDGWYAAVAADQRKALAGAGADTWTSGGTAPIFIVQAADDAVAPPANAEALKAQHPDRVEIAVIDHAGHAMLPEQPERLAALVIGALRRMPGSACAAPGR